MNKRLKLLLICMGALAAAGLMVFNAVTVINSINSARLCAALEEGDLFTAEAIAREHPHCLNTKAAYGDGIIRHISPENGDTPVCLACRKGYYDIARLFVELGADPNKGWQWSALGETVKSKRQGCYDMVVWLCENGEDPAKTNNYDASFSALWALAFTPNTEECPEEETARIFEYLYDRMGDTVESWPDILCKCARNGHYDLVSIILDKGLCGIDDRGDNYGKTALICAVGSGDLEMVKLLLDRGADRSVKDNDGKTAGEYAIGNIEMLLLFGDRD